MTETFRERVKPGSVAARMVDMADAAELRFATDAALYNLAVDETFPQMTRDLAALLYVEQKEREVLAVRLNYLGEPISIGPTEQLMRCAHDHLWIRDIANNKLKCGTCSERRTDGPY